MSNTTTVTKKERLVEVLSNLAKDDEIKYEASGGGREGEVEVRVSEVRKSEGTYCVFGIGAQEANYVIFPHGRPSGYEHEPPEACYIHGIKELPLSNLELNTHGTIQRLYIK